MADKVMIVTGTSRGIGRGVAEFFAQIGYQVAGCSRSVFSLELPNYWHSVVDVTDERQVHTWIREVKRRYGSIDVLVSNVGLVKSALLMPLMTADMVREFLNSSVIATFNVCREVAKVMLLQRRGRIITIASTMTQLHEPGTAGYSSAKSAVVELTKVMARELASYGITCNVVSPSLVLTDSTRQMGDKWRESMLALQTIQRPVEIDELCNVIEFFVAPRSGCITGQVVHTCLVS